MLLLTRNGLINEHFVVKFGRTAYDPAAIECSRLARSH